MIEFLAGILVGAAGVATCAALWLCWDLWQHSDPGGRWKVR